MKAFLDTLQATTTSIFTGVMHKIPFNPRTYIGQVQPSNHQEQSSFPENNLVCENPRTRHRSTHPSLWSDVSVRLWTVLVLVWCCAVVHSCGGRLYCYNGGQCAYNQCICAPGYHGMYCQYGELVLRYEEYSGYVLSTSHRLLSELPIIPKVTFYTFVVLVYDTSSCFIFVTSIREVSCVTDYAWDHRSNTNNRPCLMNFSICFHTFVIAHNCG